MQSQGYIRTKFANIVKKRDDGDKAAWRCKQQAKHNKKLKKERVDIHRDNHEHRMFKTIPRKLSIINHQ